MVQCVFWWHFHGGSCVCSVYLSSDRFQDISRKLWPQGCNQSSSCVFAPTTTQPSYLLIRVFPVWKGAKLLENQDLWYVLRGLIRTTGAGLLGSGGGVMLAIAESGVLLLMARLSLHMLQILQALALLMRLYALLWNLFSTVLWTINAGRLLFCWSMRRVTNRNLRCLPSVWIMFL